MRAVGALVAALLAMLALLLTATTPTASAQSGSSEQCGFLDGFRALRAGEAEAAEHATAMRSPSLHQLAMIYVERVRGNNEVSLERIYVTAYFHAQRSVRDVLSGAHITVIGSVQAATHHVRDWFDTRRQQALRNTP